MKFLRQNKGFLSTLLFVQGTPFGVPAPEMCNSAAGPALQHVQAPRVCTCVYMCVPTHTRASTYYSHLHEDSLVGGRGGRNILGETLFLGITDYSHFG